MATTADDLRVPRATRASRSILSAKFRLLPRGERVAIVIAGTLAVAALCGSAWAIVSEVMVDQPSS